MNFKIFNFENKRAIMDANRENFRLLGWNPNGIRALFEKASSEVLRLHREYDPDIVIWNEIKGNLGKHAEIEKTVTSVLSSGGINNYRWFWNHSDRAGFHGVAVSVKPNVPIISIDYGFGDGQKEEEGRLITLELEQYFIVGLYGVNAGMNGNARLEYKIEWIMKLLNYMDRLRAKGKHVIAMGDWNIAPTALDVHDPSRLEGCAGYTPQEREVFKVVEAHGWVDVFRKQNPSSREYSFFSGRTKQGKKYGGWRIDHAIVNKELNLNHCQFKILTDYNGSDHVPIFFHISDQPIKLEHRIPTIQPMQVLIQPTIQPQIIQPIPQPVKPIYHSPTVVRIRKKKDGTIVQGCDLYIGRRFHSYGYSLEESPWANPFKAKDYTDIRDCLKNYDAYIRKKIVENQDFFGKLMYFMVSQGRSLTLGCFCKEKPDDHCHGDTIVQILKEYIILLENLK